ncbi:MAG: DUF3795 domain-containing protein [Firmicutes bacterium]|nr:DUF3795 domain-containing protein [Bacillota bacterium]
MSIKEFERTDDLFSLCGLNCGLCAYRLQGGCNGCFKDSSCAAVCRMAPCSVKHGNLQYCYECSEYPCEKYDGFDSYDTLVLHRNQRKDMQKAKEIGIEAYRAEQREKIKILNRFLRDYDDGSKQVFLCLAVNMLEVNDLNHILEKAESATASMSLPEKTIFLENEIRSFARDNNISLYLKN